MNTNDFIQNHVRSGTVFRPGVTGAVRLPAVPVTCLDGFAVSVQASELHYCSPQVNDPGSNGYYTFELGYPNLAEPLLYKYADDQTRLTNTVYPHVPADIVVQVLEAHGGIDIDKTESDRVESLNHI